MVASLRLGKVSGGGSLAYVRYLSEEVERSADAADLASEYYAKEQAPETETDRLGLAIHRGEISYEDALNTLVGAALETQPVGAAVDYEGIETRCGDALIEAAARADSAEHGTSSPGRLRQDLAPALAERLGIDRRQMLTNAIVANLMNGLRADGGAVEGKHSRKDGIGYGDLTFSASKSLSAAFSQEDEAGRRVLLGVHQRAVDQAMVVVEQRLGWARKGDGGKDGVDKAEMAWFRFQHATARPVTNIIRRDASGEEYTDPHIVPVIAADPQIHSHVIILNAALTKSGRLGSIDFDRVNGELKLYGAIYHAYVAQGLRAAGIEVRRGEHGDAQISAVDPRLSDLFSKRSKQTHKAVEELAASLGHDWNTMSGPHKISLLRVAAEDTRQAKSPDAASDFAAWQKEARESGLTYSSVIGKAPIHLEMTEELRYERAFEATLPLIDRAFRDRSVIDGGALREIAARAMITAGIGDDPMRDIDAIVGLMKQRGVMQDGEAAALVFDKRILRGKEHEVVSTDRHIRTEEELTEVARTMVQDRSVSLTPEAIDRAAAQYLAAHPDTDQEHWQKQVEWAKAVAGGGRLTVGIGAAGVGKSTVVEVLSAAWGDAGKTVYGAALAWMATGELASIAEDRRAAMDPFLARVRDGTYQLDGNSVVVVDEVGLIGNRQMRELLRLGEQTGATIALIGDPAQCRSPEAGDPLELIERVMPGAIPELVSSIRQQTRHELDVVAAMRQDPAAGLAMKVEDGSARLVAGGADAVVEAAVRLRRERLEANAGRGEYSLVVMAPSNAAAAELSAAIRAERRQRGEVGPDQIVIQAVDRAGKRELAIGAGDEVRVYKRIREGRAVVANNGDTLRVLRADRNGMDVIGERSGVAARVPWRKLQRHAGDPVMLSYAGALTVETAQGRTATEALLVMSGGAGLQANRVYTALTRHREASYVLVDEVAVRQQIYRKAPIGAVPEIKAADIWHAVGVGVASQQVRENASGVIRASGRVQVAESIVHTVTAYARGRVMEVARHVLDLAERATERFRELERYRGLER